MTTARRMLHAASGLVVSGGGGGFTPDDLDNRLGWYDFTQMTAGSEGSDILEVTDQWGNGNPDSTSGDCPTWELAEINGLDVADFSGSDRWLFVNDTEMTTTTSGLPVSIWVVVNVTDATPPVDEVIFDTASGSSETTALWIDSSNDNWRVSNGTGVDLGAASTGWTTIITVWKSGGTADIWIGGVKVGDGITVGTRAPVEFIMGRFRDSSNQDFNGMIAEIGWVDDELTSQEVTDLQSYLDTKYGL